MANQNRTAADVLTDMGNAPDGAPELDTLADEFVEKLAVDARDAQEDVDDRPRRQHPPRRLQSSA